MKDDKTNSKSLWVNVPFRIQYKSLFPIKGPRI